MHPAGNDAEEGLDPERPIRTLERAQQVISHELIGTHRDVEVRIAPGTYPGQCVRWSVTMPDHSITFMPVHGGKERPVFDGGGKETWFTLRSRAAGERTNLVFRYLQVQNYGTAISFGGNRLDANSSSRGNTIYGCSFRQVGENSTAAVRLVNSAENQIANCHFVSIERQEQPYLLHAIYAAHGSSGNQILRNRFEKCCGDPIRFRDGSSDNVVAGNRFFRAGVDAAVSDWFCDHERESDCTKATAECPSWHNEVRDNLLDRNFDGWRLEPTYVFSQRRPRGCYPPTGSAERFVVSANRTP